jgi:hypothetical protein
MKSAVMFKVLIVILLVLAVFAIIPFVKKEYKTFTAGGTSITSTPNVTSPPASPSPLIRTPATITVNGTEWGRSTCYIGATEGSSRFNISDLQDLGINSYHVYGGMSRWEAQDDSGTYGYPTIDQIKANPNTINWAWWDNIMTNPPKGSDYWWDPKLPQWQGNARTLFSTLNAAHIRTIIVLRNRDDQQNPKWLHEPLTTVADWNEWWEHVFATVYWLNVRNNYNINDFEIHNEPNISGQGWTPTATETQYFLFARYTYDAIKYVYQTYLPGRPFHVYAPATSGGSWPNDALQNIPNYFDSMDVHYYGSNINSYVEEVHSWLNKAGHPNYPLWLTEWGSYKNKYNSVPFGITLINDLIYGSRPGNDYVYGSHIFSLYDFDTSPFGLISYDGTRRADYYAMRMGIRALQGCRPTYQSTTSNGNLLAITTTDAENNGYLLVTNRNSTVWYDVHANLSSLKSQGMSTMWQFDAAHMDTVVDSNILKNGYATFTIPAYGAILIKFSQS